MFTWKVDSVLFGTAILLVVLCVGIHCQEYCYQDDPNPNRNYSSAAPYVINPDLPDPVYPVGCVPIQLWILARHGTRYIDPETMDEEENYLLQLQGDLLASQGQGTICDSDMASIQSWVQRMEHSDDEKLAQTGWDELQNLASRYKMKFPELLNRTYDMTKFEFEHTNYTGNGDRTRDSARAFAEGLFGTYDNVQLTEQSSPDWLLQFYKLCDKYQQEVFTQPIPEYELFQTMGYTLDILQEVNNRSGLSEGYFTYNDLVLLYDNCRVEYGVYSDAPWCSLLTSKAIDVMEYGQDVKYYWRDAYGHEINSDQSCPLFVDLLSNFEQAVNGENEEVLVSKFAHSVTNNPFYTALGLFEDDQPLRGDDYETQGNRKWRTTLHTQMSAHIVFVLYQCDGAYQVQAYVNEEIIELPGCGGLNCPYETFKGLYESTAEQCDVEEICRVNGRTGQACRSYANPPVIWILTMIVLLISQL